MKATRFLLYVLAASLLLMACKTSRHAQRKAQKQQSTTETVKPASNTPVPSTTPTSSSPSQPQLPLQTYPYNWVSYRGTANIDFDGKKYQCSYYMVNRVDSILYLNLSLMGIEIARLVATPQEVIFVNKLSNEYYKGDYTFVEKYLKAKADFYTLQAVFNGDETKLKAYPDITVSYHRIIDAGSNRPFFDSFSMSMNNGQRKVDAQVKNLKFNTPGPTGIKIPEGFKLMTL
jgi:hypothetical protein